MACIFDLGWMGIWLPYTICNAIGFLLIGEEEREEMDRVGCNLNQIENTLLFYDES